MALTHAWHDAVHDMRDEMHDLVAIGRVDAARQAYLGLWATFVVVPLLFGLDRFAGVMNDNWNGFVATWVNDLIPGSAANAVVVFGVIELLIAAAVVVMPRIGGDLLAAWLTLFAINLFSLDGYGWAAAGTLGLAVCSLAMARMSRMYHHHEG
jgi:hypothetical protein